MPSDLIKYYLARANEYDRIYLKPERQDDLRLLSHQLQNLLAERRVLEIACGTGYWTQFIAPVASEVVATDYNSQVLQLARSRLSELENISLVADDALSLEQITSKFTASYAGFWWSHLEKNKIQSFLAVLHSKLKPGSRVVFADNVYVKGNSTEISRIDHEGNTYQLRQLCDGTEYEVLKNFPSATEFSSLVPTICENVQFKETKYFWYGYYDLPA